MENNRHGKYDRMFQILETLIGKEITCIYGDLGQENYQGVRGILSEVEPYKSITINGSTFDFIGERTAIVHVSTMVEGKRVLLYLNTNVKKPYRGYFYDPMGLVQAQTSQLGYSVKAEEMDKGNSNNMLKK